MAYQFNGTNQYLDAPTASTLAFGTGDYTLSVVINATSFSGSPVFYDTRSGPTNTGVAIYADTAGKPIAFINSTNTIIGSAVATGAHHLLVLSRSSGVHTLYVNAASAGTYSTSANLTDTSLTIGTAVDNKGNSFNKMNGTISEVAAWSSALTTAEITSLSQGFTAEQIRPQSLVFYAPLIRNLQDVRGGRTITNNNGATVAVHPRIIT